MEQLEQIPIGQQPNDGTGDPLRNGMAKVNANFAKVQTGVDTVELTATNAAQTAGEAKVTADAAIPAAQKGMAGGVAPLDASGKVPAAHLEDYLLAEEKGAAGGVAPLDAGAKVPVANLPAGTAGGVAPLGADGKVPAVNLPAAEDSIPLSQKGQPGGVATLDTGGKVPAGQLPPIPTGPPAGSVAWWPLRSSTPAGQIPADGQTLSRATFPDLAAMVAAGTVPLATESDWLADPRNRGCYTLGDGSTTIRVPDLNGRSTGSLGRVFLSGDGTDSNGAWGVIQRDQFQNHSHLINIKTTVGGAGQAFGQVDYGLGVGSQYSTVDAPVQNGAAAGVPRVGNKTHPQNVTGVWTIQAFGTVTNPGSVDAAQLASDYARLSAAFQSEVAFTMLYPGGGNAASPGNVTINSRYVMSNPWPGLPVLAIAEVLMGTVWTPTGWRFLASDNSQGVAVGQYGDSVVLQTGIAALWNRGDWQGSPIPASNPGISLTTLPCRVKVWKVKGG